MSSNGRHFGEIRLSALKKAPEMFGSVYEHEEKKPWAFAERLRDAVAFGAYIDGEIIGAVGLQTGGRPQGRSQGACPAFSGARTAKTEGSPVCCCGR